MESGMAPAAFLLARSDASPPAARAENFPRGYGRKNRKKRRASSRHFSGPFPCSKRRAEVSSLAKGMESPGLQMDCLNAFMAYALLKNHHVRHTNDVQCDAS